MKIRKTTFITLILCAQLAGYFIGIRSEEKNQIERVVENKKVAKDILEIIDDSYFWMDGYMKRDSVLWKISKHEDCTFKLRAIIGEIH